MARRDERHIPSVCKRGATPPGGMHRRRKWHSYSRTSPNPAIYSAIAFTLQSVASVSAQQPASPESSGSTQVTAVLRDVARVESWSFFEPPPGGDPSTPLGTGSPDYVFVGNRLTFGVKAEGRRWAAEGALQYIQLWNLPSAAYGPGALGTGALYFAASETATQYQLYPRRLALTLKDLMPGVSFMVGRMGYASGAEAASGVPAIEAVKRERLDARLLGEFEWSIVQRAFDGVRLDVDRTGWHATAALMMPTQGGFEESATPTITDIKVAAGSVTFRPHVVLPWSELQLFVDVYRDRRPVASRPDNTGLAAIDVDVTVTAFGASQVGVFPTVAGELDSLVWVAGQLGDWYGQGHRAFSAAGEIGHRWTAVDWRPWVRAGFLYASGDGDPRDDDHGTFFQMLPTLSRYSASTTYSQMNLRDLFVQAHAYPRDRIRVRVDLHRVDLAQGEDRWYSGSGATARQGGYFGYEARPSGGERGLGTVLEGWVDVAFNRRWSVNGYVGTIWGGDVVRRLFADDRLRFFYLENVLSF